jgi:RNA polymerase sigma-70 factor (ECF subfamily)
MSPAESEDLSAAIDATVQRFARLVRAAAVRHGLRDADLDEVMQDVRIRLWKTGAQGEAIARLPTSYVYRTATSAAVDLIRRRRRGGGAAELVSINEAEGEALEARESADDKLWASAASQQMARAVDVLPAPRRAVIRMYLAGYERDEIARLLGWTEGKTRNLLYRGIAELKQLLTDARGQDL